MSLDLIDTSHTPLKDSVSPADLLKVTVLTPSHQEIPESRGSVESRDDYGFWDTPEQSNGHGDAPLTPLTPPDLPDRKDDSDPFLDVPASPSRLRKSKSEDTLSISPTIKVKSENETTDVKIESDDHQPGWLFGTNPLKLKKENASPGSLVLHDAFFKQPPLFEFSDPIPSHAARKAPFKRWDRDAGRGSNNEEENSHSSPSTTEDNGCAYESPSPSPAGNSCPPRIVIEESKSSSTTGTTVSIETDLSKICLEQQTALSSSQHTQRMAGPIRKTVKSSEIEEHFSAKATVTSDAFGRLLPLNIQQRLEERSDICVASLVRNKLRRCTIRAHCAADETKCHLKFLSEVDISLDFLGALRSLEGLINSSLCTWHNKIATVELEQCRTTLNEPSGNEGHSTRSRSNIAVAFQAAFSIWMKSLVGLAPPEVNMRIEESIAFEATTTSDSNLATSTSKIKTEIEVSTTASKGPDSAELTTIVRGRRKEKSTDSLPPSVPKKLQPWRPKNQASWTPQRTISAALIKPLTPREQSETGFIYVYWIPGNFGYVKIGKSRDVGKRLLQWESKCKHAIKKHYSDCVEVPHVFRVETLIHAELSDVRYREMGCKGCLKNHREWFQVSAAHARKVIDRWTGWIRGERYTLLVASIVAPIVAPIVGPIAKTGSTKTKKGTGKTGMDKKKEPQGLWILTDGSVEAINVLSEPLAMVPVEKRVAKYRRAGPIQIVVGRRRTSRNQARAIPRRSKRRLDLKV